MLKLVLSVLIALTPIGLDALRFWAASGGKTLPSWFEVLGEGGLILIAVTLAAEAMIDLASRPAMAGWLSKAQARHQAQARMIAAFGCFLTVLFSSTFYMSIRGGSWMHSAVVWGSFLLFGAGVVVAGAARALVGERS